MTVDGGLRGIFRAHLPLVHWVTIESGLTGAGIPDSNGCYLGVEFWVEYKQTTAINVRVDPFQVSWHERRARAGGRTFFAVRRKAEEGPRREGRDDLWLYRGRDARSLFISGLAARPLATYVRGPARWDWDDVLFHLTGIRP